MSNTITGLAAIQKFKEEQEAARAAANRPKADWFKWPQGKTVATVRFLQELDRGANNFREDRGLGLFAVEHQAPGPDGFKRRALCTKETEGECFACERHAARVEADKGQWRQRTNFYTNAIVDFGDGDKKVVVISRPFNASFTQALIEEAVDEGSITDSNFKITKTGEGTTTQWLLKRLKGEPFDDSSVELHDLNASAVREVPYDKQPEYYGAVYKVESEVKAGPASAGFGSSTSDDDSW